MANTYYDATGYLVLKKVTPVIETLFEHLNISEKASGLEPGQAYIGDIAEDSDSQWESIIEYLASELAPKLGITLTGQEENAVVLTMIADHFKANPGAFRKDCIDGIDFDEEADYEQLYKLARYFDDGHGLTQLLMQGCWHSDQPRLDSFGGNCILMTENGTFKSGTNSATYQAKQLDVLLQSNQMEQAAQEFVTHIQRQLDQITNKAQRDLVATILKHKIAGMATL